MLLFFEAAADCRGLIYYDVNERRERRYAVVLA